MTHKRHRPARNPAAQQSPAVPEVCYLSVEAREPLAVKRRQFITLIGGAAAWPLAARAQKGGKLPTIGLLGSGTLAAQSQWTAAFVQRLRELGWTDGRNVTIEYRWAEGRIPRFAEIAEELVRLKVDVIVTHNTPPILPSPPLSRPSRPGRKHSTSCLLRSCSSTAFASIPWRSLRGCRQCTLCGNTWKRAV